MADNEQTTIQAAETGLRDVPGDIREYEKFKAEGGLEHNEKILGREAATAAAKAAGVLPEAEPSEERKTHNRFQQRVNRLQRKIGERDAQIAELQKRLAEPAAPGVQAGAQAQNGNHAPAAAKPAAESESAKPNGAATTPPRPKEEDFKTYSEFVEALTEWMANRQIEIREAKRAEERARSQNESKSKEIIDAHNARVDEAKTRYSDWGSVFKGLDDNSFSDPMVVFIFESDRGPDVTYYLATHRDELERIRKLSPLRQAAALGRIEDALPAEGEQGEGESEKSAKPAAKAAEDEEEDREPPKRKASGVSKAPPPAKPLGGRAAADDSMPDPKDFQAYEAWAKRQQAKGVKR